MCKRLLIKAQNQLFKAHNVCSYEIPPDEVESWVHFVAKNLIVSKLGATDWKSKFDFGGYIPDVVAKIDSEWIIVEAETDPKKQEA